MKRNGQQQLVTAPWKSPDFHVRWWSVDPPAIVGVDLAHFWTSLMLNTFLSYNYVQRTFQREISVLSFLLPPQFIRRYISIKSSVKMLVTTGLFIGNSLLWKQLWYNLLAASCKTLQLGNKLQESFIMFQFGCDLTNRSAHSWSESALCAFGSEHFDWLYIYLNILISEQYQHTNNYATYISSYINLSHWLKNKNKEVSSRLCLLKSVMW